jgi:hypothetical protein
MSPDLFRETLPLGSPKRGVVFAAFIVAGFVGMWLTILKSFTPSDGLLFALLGATMVAIVLLVTRSQLRTIVQRDAVVLELSAVRDKRTISSAALRGATVGSFTPVVDDDGWGVLRGVRPSLAWSPSVRRGVWLQRNEGPALFIPSRRPDELASAILSIM